MANAFPLKIYDPGSPSADAEGNVTVSDDQFSVGIVRFIPPRHVTPQFETYGQILSNRQSLYYLIPNPLGTTTVHMVNNIDDAINCAILPQGTSRNGLDRFNARGFSIPVGSITIAGGVGGFDTTEYNMQVPYPDDRNANDPEFAGISRIWQWMVLKIPTQRARHVSLAAIIP